nr:A-kinase anchor protein 10, mitochondrial-like [Dermacentor andersoni]XP_050028563.1 A-kinase anchor protein 10, mitochondrial-like [Dermacentor andersoni]
MPLFRRKPDKPQDPGELGGEVSGRQVSRHGSQASLHAPNGTVPADASMLEDADPPPPSPLQSAEEEYEPNLCVRTKSRLSKTLDEVLQDAGALAYFIQFAEEQGARPLVKFWMEAQSFHASCLLRRSSASCQASDKDSPLPNGTPANGEKIGREPDGEQHSAGDCQPVGRCDADKCLKATECGIPRSQAAASPFGNGLNEEMARCPSNKQQTCESSPMPGLPCLGSRKNPCKSSHSQCLSSSPRLGAMAALVPCGTDPLQAANSLPQDSPQAVTGGSVVHPSSVHCTCRQEQDCAPSVATKGGSAGVMPCGSVVQPAGGEGGEAGGHRSSAGGTNLRTMFTCNLNGAPPVVQTSSSQEGNKVDITGETLDGPDISTRPMAGRRDSLSQDAMHIYNTYIAQNAPLPIGVPDDLRNCIQDSVSRNPVEPECFFEAQQFAVTQMEKDLYPNFLRSPYLCKHQVDVLTSGNVSLADILYNDSALFYFMEFMEQEQSRHLVDFLLMADNFRNHLLAEGSCNPTQAQDDAMVIYDKYFSLQATSPLGFSDAVRLEVEQNICREEGPLPSCFEKPVMVLLQYLEKNHLKAFLSSQLYVKYISECIVTIQTAQSDTDSLRRKKRSGSDSSSSDLSSLASQPSAAPTTNTLLAVDGSGKWLPGTPSTRRILRHIEGSDMKIDSGQFNPDALWKRSLAGKLQMAHVDHLGKLTTEFEPEPDKKTGSNLTKAFRKLVNWEADKTEEDMAWQVAEMIVKDICSVTLCPDATSQDVG